MINTWITELVQYGIREGLVASEDVIYTTNRLLELLKLQEYIAPEGEIARRPLSEILDDLMGYAHEQGILPEDTIGKRDLFDTKIMGLLTPPPSTVRLAFKNHLAHSSQEATDYYYSFSKATNYIRTDRIAKDEKWVAKTEYGDLDITINLSKPEKDPRDIAKAGQAKKSGYPACLLCAENEGYAGHISHPARQNHRIIPMQLDGENYYLQYSPYVYYNEHCIIFNEQHIPMVINRATFSKLLDFVGQFPHYIAGSNADLPIVGGSILSHDHFQGGNYEFAMAKALVEEQVTIPGYPEIVAGIGKWPMSVLRINSEDKESLVDCADHILKTWRGYTDEDAFILSETDGVPHNTITPIARMRNGKYELDLVLRNNITTEECPLGYYHPHSEYHHIKKENIGLIEVMGLAILPARLKAELADLERAILAGEDIAANETLAKHADWVKEILPKHEVTAENIHGILQTEIGIVFSHILENAGVYKRTPEGKAAFLKFVGSL